MQNVTLSNLKLCPEAVEKVRADSFVMETSSLSFANICNCQFTCGDAQSVRFSTKNIHSPTESSLLYDGLRKIIEMCVLLAEEPSVAGSF